MTARPLAAPARSGARPTATETPSGNRLPSPTPRRARPAERLGRGGGRPRHDEAGEGHADRHREQRRRGVPPRQPATHDASHEHASEVAHHQRHGGVDRDVERVLHEAGAPRGDAPLGRRGADQHPAQHPEGPGEAAAHRRQVGRRVERRRARPAPRQHRDDERGQDRDPPAGVGGGGHREHPDQHEVGQAGGDVGLGERDRAQGAVVVGQAGLHRRQHQAAADPHQEGRRRPSPRHCGRPSARRSRRPAAPRPTRPHAGDRPARRARTTRCPRPRFRPRTPPRAGRRPGSPRGGSSRRCGTTSPGVACR